MIKLLPRYLLTYGLLSGLILFVEIELLRLKKIKVNGIKHPIHLRRNSTDALVFQEVFLFELYNLSRPNTGVIIDAGGNIGLTSIFFATKFPHAKIYSVEPCNSNFSLFLENAKGYPAIIPIHSALWNKDTSLKIIDKNESHWAFAVTECSTSDPHAFKAVSLNSLMKKYNMEYIDVLKLDIEGAERELFAENYDYWITRTRCILLELHDWLKPDCSKTVFKTLSMYNFKTTIFKGMLLLVNTDLD